MVRLFKQRRPTIRRQLLTIVLVPSITLIVLALAVTISLARSARDSRSLQQTVADASAPAATAILGLQEERLLSLVQLAGGEATGLAQTRLQVDAGLAEVATVITPLVDRASATDTQRQLGALTGSGEELTQLRAAIDAGQIDIPTVYQSFNEVLSTFGNSLRAATQEAPDAASAYDQLTSVDLFFGAESLWRSATLTEVALNGVDLDENLAEDFQARYGAYHAQLAALSDLLQTTDQDTLSAITGSTDWQLLDSVQQDLAAHLATGDRSRNWTTVGLSSWEAALTAVGQDLATLYGQHSQAAAQRSDDTVRDEEIQAWAIGGALLAAGLVVVLAAVRMSGQVARRLRKLRDDTRRLSSTRLPEAVDRLRHGKEPGDTISPLKYGDDEIGEVAQAFNEAQDTAVRAAADEAKARAGTRDVFLNIARRTQGISYQQLKILDEAQEHVEDPTHLKLLFELDHLATRARRHAENLVILGGKQPGRRWSKPVPLIDVVRGATGETINFEQVRARRIPMVAITADKVADVIHILAELIDNATSFGPPGSTVDVNGEVVGKGVVLEVEDRGLGMSPDQREQLNRQLQDPPDFGDMALSADTRLGLFVVGRLALRHGIRVTLRESGSYGGTLVVVLLPTTLLVDPLVNGPAPASTATNGVPLNGFGTAKAISVPGVRPPES